ALIDRFGFSRTVVREAIAALRADGLVESRQGAGVFVLGPKPVDEGLKLFTDETNKISDIIEELELRIGIEVEAAGLAAARSSPAQEAEIEAQVERFADLMA
ncbi:MAG: FadR family transcriptional regulator, partial [Mesorhizobium sp.]